MADETTTVHELREAVDAFVAARDWHQFHNPKDLAISIAIEAAELMEEYQWYDATQVSASLSDPAARQRTRFELADVVIYCLCLANTLDLDLAEAVQDKLAISGRKYPAAEYRGLARKPGQGAPEADPGT